MAFHDLPHNKIHAARKRIEWEEEDWLRARGWKATSSTPGAYWMWQKEWEGKTFLVDRDTACRIQAYWDADEYYKAHPEEFND